MYVCKAIKIKYCLLIVLMSIIIILFKSLFWINIITNKKHQYGNKALWHKCVITLNCFACKHIEAILQAQSYGIIVIIVVIFIYNVLKFHVKLCIHV